jgi:hypothetical protein
MNRLLWKILAVTLFGLAGLLPVRLLDAQSLPQVDQAQQVQRVRDQESPQASEEEPDLYSGEEDDTGLQLAMKPLPPHRWDWVNVALDTQYFYTSNAYETSAKAQGTGLLVSTIDAELDAPPIVIPYGLLFATAGYQYEWFDYGPGGPGGKLDFDSATVYAEGHYQLPDQWSIFGELSYNRLLNDGNGFKEFYKELVPSFRFEKTVQIRQDVQFSAEYISDFRFTDEVPYPNQNRDCNNRLDQALDFTLTWQVSPKIFVGPFYYFQYSHYPNYFAGQSRNDFLNTLGLSVDYCFNSWSSVRLFFDYEIRDSDASLVPDYQKLDAGGGLSANLKF